MSVERKEGGSEGGVQSSKFKVQSSRFKVQALPSEASAEEGFKVESPPSGLRSSVLGLSIPITGY
jgi:hypothetical protein